MLRWLSEVSQRWGIAYPEEEMEKALMVFRKSEETWRGEDEGQGLEGVGGMEVEGEGSNPTSSSSSSSSSFSLSNGTTPPPSTTATAVLLSDWNEAYLDPFTFSDRFEHPTEHHNHHTTTTTTHDHQENTSFSSIPYIPGKTSTHAQRTVYHRNLQALAALERSLCLFRAREPEEWSTSDRMVVLACFMDKVHHNTSCQHILSTHPVNTHTNTPSHYTLLTHTRVPLPLISVPPSLLSPRLNCRWAPLPSSTPIASNPISASDDD